MAVYFFYGEEDFNIDLEINKMRSKLNQDFLSMSYQFLDNPEFPVLINALRTIPMMFGRMLVVADIFNYYFSDDYNFDDKELTEIENALNNASEELDIVFVVRIPRGSNKKIDSRRKLTKILSKFSTKEFPQFSIFKTAEIAAWIKSRAKEKDLNIKEDAANLLIEQIGTNLLQFDKELDKLKLIAFPEKTITKKMVEENCTSNQDLFNITNYIMKGEMGKALLEYKQLLDVKYPLEIISAVQTMLRQWIIIKAKSKSPIQEIMKLTGIRSDYRVQKLKEDLRNVSLKDLVRLKENLFNVEYKIKSGQIIDMESEVECAFIR